MNYWLLQYIGIFIAYLFTMYLWPTVVFHRHLNKKSRIYWFGFCSIGMPLLVNTAITFLGLLHILNNFVTFVLFHGVFLVQLFRNYRLSEDSRNHLRYLVQGTMKPKTFIRNLFLKTVRGIAQLFRKLWDAFEGKRVEYILLFLIIAYGTAFYAVAPLQQHSFGFSDMPVHHSWVYGLRIGKIFYDGIYPQAMHCFAYLLSTAFFFKTFNVLVYLGAIHVCTIFLSIYCYFKELFHWKYSAHIALLLILTVEMYTMNMSFSFARMENSLPQEFAIGGQFLIPAFLLRYLRSTEKFRVRGKRTRFYWDDNMTIFILGLAETITVHFYATGMAFYLCVPIAVILLPRVLNYKRFFPLVAGVLTGVFIAVGPMVLAYAEGIPLQGSLQWGMNVINGQAATQTYTNILSSQKEEFSKGSETIADASEYKYLSTSVIQPVRQTLIEIDPEYLRYVLHNAYVFYTSLFRYSGYYSFFYSVYADFLITLSLICAGAGLVLHLFTSILSLIAKKAKRKPKIPYDYFDSYIILPLSAFTYIFMYVGPSIGFPQLIAIIRLNAVIQILNLGVCVIPLDFGFLLIDLLLRKKITNILGIGALSASLYAVFALGLYHSNMYFGIMRYNSVIDVTNRIVDSFPKQHFTIVSTTDEYYQMVEQGFHEEMLDFLWKQDDDHYTIPTPYVFVYVEKHSILWGQAHEFSAPAWMADRNKRNAVPCVSFEPEVAYIEISDEYAEMNRPNRRAGSEAMMRENLRVIMNSKMQKWIEKFEKLHPNNISTYYEDDDFVCYLITQNPARLFELAID